MEHARVDGAKNARDGAQKIVFIFWPAAQRLHLNCRILRLRVDLELQVDLTETELSRRQSICCRLQIVEELILAPTFRARLELDNGALLLVGKDQIDGSDQPLIDRLTRTRRSPPPAFGSTSTNRR
jgi:hypothetical protein